MFRVGQKVVRLGVQSAYDRSFSCEGWPPRIKVGGVYTIRDIDTRAAVYGWPVGLRFEEYIEQPWDSGELGLGMWEPVFPADCFRPVVERKTDISIFQKMLTDERLPDLVILHRLLERT